MYNSLLLTILGGTLVAFTFVSEIFFTFSSSGSKINITMIIEIGFWQLRGY